LLAGPSGMKAVSRRSLDNLVGYRTKGSNSLRNALRFASVKRFHDSYYALSASRGTEGVYLSAIEALSRYLSKDPDDLVRSLSNATESEIAELVQGFVNKLVDEEKAPKTIQAYVSAVKGFLEINDIEVPSLRRKLRKPRVYVRTVDRAPTLEELRKVCAICDAETRALILFLLASGCRIGEALVLRRADLEPRDGSYLVRIRPEIAKDRIGRYAFITTEAFVALEAYLKTHESLMLFPLTRSRAYHKLTDAFSKGIEVKITGKRRDVHPHSLRKLFFTTALKVLGRELAEALIGHKQYLDQAYRRLSLEEMASAYERLEPSLTLFSQAPVDRGGQVVVSATEIERLLPQGYEFLALLPDGKAVLRTPTSKPS